jgi:hypothetical protein
MADAPNLFERLRRHWAEQGLDTGAPQSEAEVASREERYDVAFPADVRAYFQAVNGMARHREFDKEWDRDLIRFFPLEEFQPLDEQWPDTAVLEAGDLFMFADYSISGWEYAVRVRGKDSGAVYVVYDPETVLVATSFSEFLERYVARDYTAIYPR